MHHPGLPGRDMVTEVSVWVLPLFPGTWHDDGVGGHSGLLEHDMVAGITPQPLGTWHDDRERVCHPGLLGCGSLNSCLPFPPAATGLLMSG